MTLTSNQNIKLDGNSGMIWQRPGLSQKLALTLAALAVASCAATVAVMMGWQDTPNPETVLWLLYLDAFLLLLLGVIVSLRLVSIWLDQREGRAGSGLHTRLVLMFGFVAITPAILVAVFSALFLNFGIHNWFSERVSTALSSSHSVARSYLHEHQQNIRADVLATANDLNNEAAMLMQNPRGFNTYLSRQAGIRSFQEALVVDGSGRVLARSAFSQSLEFDLLPDKAMKEASKGRVVVLSIEEDRVRAIVKLDRFLDAYFLAGRFIDPQVIEYIDRTARAVDQYKNLEEKQEGIKITFVMIFVVVALLLLMAAVWVGMTLAGQLSRPISGLILASNKVSKGYLSARVPETSKTDEISILGRSFNRMTSQLERQQQGLVEANRQLDERIRFTETVLTGVSAGVIGLDDKGCIHLPNRSASKLLGMELENEIGKDLLTIMPEISELLKKIRKRPDKVLSEEIKIERNGQSSILLVNIAAEKLGIKTLGYVVTFDDVTLLLSAQRKAAWADVARRIAHEIKNPLTPIQLSAERLRRRYMKHIKNDPDTFSLCTDTIIRQVEEIGKMVDEFSSFARMPQATLKNENLSEICHRAVFLERNRHNNIDYQIDLPDSPVYLRCDSLQISQAMTNLLKNAAESVSNQDGEKKGVICCSLSQNLSNNLPQIAIAICDNGPGLPEVGWENLTEPYVTSRDGGTGLGLAIVKKIMEDHNGKLILSNNDEGGATIKLLFHPNEEKEKTRTKMELL